MSSSFKGYWINGSKDIGFTADRHSGAPANAPEKIEKQPTLSAIKKAIVAALPATPSTKIKVIK